MQTQVAVKVLRTNDHDKIARFQKEAKILSSLKHPNIVSIAAFGQESSIFYLVMDLVEGQSIKQSILKHSLDKKQAASLALQICSAMEYAHAQGVWNCLYLS